MHDRKLIHKHLNSARLVVLMILVTMFLGAVHAQEQGQPSAPSVPLEEQTPAATPAPESTPPVNSGEDDIEKLFAPDKPKDGTEEQGEAEPNKEPLIYVADTDNGRIVVMQGLDGSGYTSLGMPGYGYGRFLRPTQVWVDYDGRLYIADSGNDRVVRIDQRSQQGWSEMGGFSSPMGVAVDGSGVYVADTKKDRIVLLDKVQEDGKILETLTHAQMTNPTSLWIDADGALYICCGQDPPGGKVFKTWMDKDRRRWLMFEGEGLSGARFRPSGLVTAKKSLRLIDGSGQRVVTMQDMQGTRLREQDFKGDRRWRLSRPQAMAVDASGERFFIADSGNDRILEVKSDGTVVEEFSQIEGDPTTVLRNPGSIFVSSPAPPPKPPEEDDEDGKGKKKKKDK